MTVKAAIPTAAQMIGLKMEVPAATHAWAGEPPLAAAAFVALPSLLVPLRSPKITYSKHQA